MITVREEHLLPALEGTLLTYGEALLELLGLSHCEISLCICDDPQIQALNQQWRRQDKPTDVLSFPMLEDSLVSFLEGESPWPPGWGKMTGPPLLLGDIVISAPTCLRQAERYNHTYEDEAKRLLTHGLLHLCGYDHERGEHDAKIMYRREDMCLTALLEHPIQPVTQVL